MKIQAAPVPMMGMTEKNLQMTERILRMIETELSMTVAFLQVSVPEHSKARVKSRLY